MKKIFLSLSMIALMSLNSCKNEKNKNTSIEPEFLETTVHLDTLSNYLIDTTVSIIKWTGEKPTGKHKGTVALQNGGFIVTDGKVENGLFVIDMTSISVVDLVGKDKTKLENHLKGLGGKESEDHFFNTTKFPTSTFKITSLEETLSIGSVKAILTLKGIAKPVEFPAEIVITNDSITLHSNPFKINRTQWNVTYASKSFFDDLKDRTVDDEIELEVFVKALKK